MVRLGAPMNARILPVLLTVLLIGACAPGDEAARGSAGEPRTLVAPAPDADGLVRVLVYHDMEGLTGQSDPNTFRFTHTERYALGRTYLTGDMNAVVEGLFEVPEPTGIVPILLGSMTLAGAARRRANAMRGRTSG